VITSLLAIVDAEHDACLEELVVRRLAPLPGLGVAVLALLMRCSDRLPAGLRGAGVAARPSAAVASPDWTAVRNLITAAREADAQALYSHGTSAHMLSSLAGPTLGIPVVAHLWRPLAPGDTHAATLCHSTIVVATEAARAHALAAGCADVAVIPTPVRRGATMITPGAGACTFGWAASQLETDGWDLFVTAASAVAAASADVRFRCSVPEAARIAMPRSLAPRSTIMPLGFDGSGFTAGIDVFVHTAWQDATHITLVDALARGLPVVATTADGSAELLERASGLHLYAPGNVDALIDEMLAAAATRHQGATRRSPCPTEGDDAARSVLDLVGKARRHRSRDLATS